MRAEFPPTAEPADISQTALSPRASLPFPVFAALPALARSSADTWPGKAVRIVVPLARAAGDITARLVGR